IRPVTLTFFCVIAFGLMFTSCNNRENNPAQSSDSITAVIPNTKGDPLPSWNEGDVKKGIIQFVTTATKEGSSGFIPVNDRIAVFDNDGTLWSEQPLYFQFIFSLDKIKEMATQHPDWKTKEPFKSILDGDVKKALAQGEKAYAALLGTTMAGMTSKAFDQSVKEWISNAKHPTTKRLYTEMVFQPMLELLNFLRANGFQTFIVSGGDIDFIRAWAEKVYGIPPQQIVGSTLDASYQVKNDTPFILREPKLSLLNDGPGKPVGIYRHIGKKPVFAAGNSDGDYQMLQWTASNTVPHMEIIVHHTDSIREWKYDRGSSIGRLEKGLDDAKKYGWILVDMKRDWKKVYPFE
ncbi:MAG TPA: HAD family hydrolase, partial [Puia sp.]|nr:HAD family hydrolase [Puia sp.]